MPALAPQPAGDGVGQQTADDDRLDQRNGMLAMFLHQAAKIFLGEHGELFAQQFGKVLAMR